MQLIKIVVQQNFHAIKQIKLKDRKADRHIHAERQRGREVGNQKCRLARSKAIETSLAVSVCLSACLTVHCSRFGFKFDFGREIKRATEIYSGKWRSTVDCELFKARSHVMELLFCTIDIFFLFFFFCKQQRETET